MKRLTNQIDDFWWLKPRHLSSWSGDPVAMGYEIVRAHPGYRSYCETHAPKDSRRQLAADIPWVRLKPMKRQWFMREFAKDLRRIGCLELVHLVYRPSASRYSTPIGITFDCRMSTERVLRGFDVAFAGKTCDERPSSGAQPTDRPRGVGPWAFCVQSANYRPERGTEDPGDPVAYRDAFRGRFTLYPIVTVYWDKAVSRLAGRRGGRIEPILLTLRAAFQSLLDRDPRIRSRKKQIQESERRAEESDHKANRGRATHVVKVPDSKTVAWGLTAIWLERLNIRWTERPKSIDEGLGIHLVNAVSARPATSAIPTWLSEQKGQVERLWSMIHLPNSRKMAGKIGVGSIPDDAISTNPEADLLDSIRSLYDD